MRVSVQQRCEDIQHRAFTITAGAVQDEDCLLGDIAGQCIPQRFLDVAHILFIAAVPYEGFERGWDNDWKRRYHAVLSAADFVKYICDHYHRGCFQIRNEWMVDRSALLIAAYTGEKGGTKNTVDYAAHKGVQTIFVL